MKAEEIIKIQVMEVPEKLRSCGGAATRSPREKIGSSHDRAVEMDKISDQLQSKLLKETLPFYH